eukprot:2238990-Rhodomonas_salina.1
MRHPSRLHAFVDCVINFKLHELPSAVGEAWHWQVQLQWATKQAAGGTARAEALKASMLVHVAALRGASKQDTETRTATGGEGAGKPVCRGPNNSQHLKRAMKTAGKALAAADHEGEGDTIR